MDNELATVGERARGSWGHERTGSVLTRLGVGLAVTATLVTGVKGIFFLLLQK